MTYAPPSRRCMIMSATMSAACRHKARWWVSYFQQYGPAAKVACDQHLAAAIRLVRRRDVDSVFGEKLPAIYAITD